MEIRDFISREWFASCDYEVDLIIRFFFFLKILESMKLYLTDNYSYEIILIGRKCRIEVRK